MPRTTPVAYRRIAYVESTGDGLLDLLVIDHADLVEPLRFVNDGQAATSDGDLYQPFPFTIRPPAAVGDGTFTQTRLELDTVDQSMIVALRSVTTPLTVEHKQVLMSDPDSVTAGPWNYEVRGEQGYDAQRMELLLTFAPVLEESCPWKRLSPARAPGLF